MAIMQGNTPVETIWVHQTTTRPQWMAGEPLVAKIAEVRAWHVGDGWKDIGYQYLIDRDGTIGTGRPETEVGAHVAGHNIGSIGIALVGGHGASKNDPFDRHFTPAQDAALRGLIDDIQARAGNICAVRGHSEVADKACPGFNVSAWAASPVMPRDNPWQSTTLQAAATNGAAGTITVATAVSTLTGTAQLIVVTAGVIGIATACWVFRERIIKWTRGVR